MLKKIAKIIILITSVSAIATGCGRSSLYEETSTNNTSITSVKGVSFDIPTSFLNEAVTISEILASEDYSGDTYLWSNSDSEYMFFNMRQVVIAVSNKTAFNIRDAKEKEAALKGQDLNNLWFQKDGNKLKYETDDSDGSYKFMAKVKSQVSVTSSSYGDFVGRFVLVQKDGYECSMFIGVPGTSYKDISKEKENIIIHIAKSLKITPDSVEAVHMENDEEPTTETAHNTIKYLSVGEQGKFTAVNANGDIETGDITLQQISDGKGAEKVIKKYLKRSDSKYRYEAAPDGYKWCLAKYMVSRNPKDLYPNIKVEDISGKNLTGADGNKVTTRTMDIFCYMKESKKGFSDLYCYYLVPKDCTEYILECGIKNAENSATTTCYKISGQDKGEDK